MPANSADQAIDKALKYWLRSPARRSDAMTLFAPVPNQSSVQVALRAFLLNILPSGTEVFEGQDNRVPEPRGTNFVVMTPMLRKRLATNIDTSQDCPFTGSIAANVLTASDIQFGAITIGNQVFGPNVADATLITAQTSGPPGGAGTYTVSGAPQTVSSETMASGTLALEQKLELTFQLDVHAATVAAGSDMAQTISTAFRDDYATLFFSRGGYADISPLYADDPKQVPFQNAEEEWETRYVVDACLQVNQVITVPQEFADEAQVTLIPADVEYPA